MSFSRIVLNVGALLLGTSLTFNVIQWKARAEAPKNVSPTAAAATESSGPIRFKSLMNWYDDIVLRFDTNGSSLQVPQTPPVSVSPELKFTWSCNGDEIRLSGDFVPGETYVFKVAAGLETKHGGRLEKEIAVSQKIPDAYPSLRFLASGIYLPRKTAKMEFIYATRNVRKARVTLLKAYENNLNPYEPDSRHARSRMKEIASEEITLDTPRNAEVNHVFSLERLLPGREPGAYRLEFDGDFHWGRKGCDFVLTDLGVVTVLDPAGRSAAVFVRSLSENKPMAAAELQLLSKNNQTVATGKTGGDGMARLQYRSDFDAGSDAPAGILVKTAEDLTYFRLDDAHATDAPAPVAIDRARAFLFTERGVCRPGESFDVSLFARAWKAEKLETLANVPVEVSILDPQGKIFVKRTVTLDGDGAASFAVELPKDAALGTYDIVCGDGWGKTSIMVAAYVPDKIKVELKSKIGDQIDFTVQSDYYFGAPVSGGEYRFSVDAMRGPAPAHWPKGWTVGDQAAFKAGSAFNDNGVLDANGKISIRYPGFAKGGGVSYGPVQLIASTTVSEPGGRGVSAYVYEDICPADYFLGLRKEPDNTAKELVVALKLLTARKELPAVPSGDCEVEFELSRVEWDYVVVRNGNTYRREWQRKLVRLQGASRRVAVPASGDCFYRLEKHPEGLYELRASATLGGAPMVSVLEFYHSQGESGGRPSSPLALTFKTDAETYPPGSVAKVTFASPGPGEVLVGAGELKLDSARSFPVAAGINTIEIPVPTAVGSSSYYAGLTLLTRGERTSKRAFGLLQLKIDQAPAHRLALTLGAPQVAKPGETVKIRVALADGAGKPCAGAVKVFAVDQGVLALTGYRTPDVYSCFYGDFGNPLEFFDVYDKLYPELKILPDGRIGGDGRSFGFAASDVDAVKQKECARVIFPVTAVPAGGEIELEAVMPDHLGSLRLMAVAVNADGAGSADCAIVLRDRIGASAGATRFLAPGDEAELSFSLFNHDLEESDYRFAVALPDYLTLLEGSSLEFKGKLAKGASAVVRFRVRALGKGGGKLDWRLTMGPEARDGWEFLSVRPVEIAGTKQENIVVAAGQSVPFSPDSAVWEPGAKGGVRISNSPAANLGTSLDWLNRYPYGCLEQTVAGAFPFLIVDDLLKGGVITPEMAEAHRHKVASAYARLLPMQLERGTFAMWPGSSEEWLDGTIFAAHFIFEAVSAKKIIADDRVLHPLKVTLRSCSGDASEENRMRRAYAIYGLAVAGDDSFINSARNLLSDDRVDFASFLASLALVKGGYAADGAAELEKAVREKVWLADAPLFGFSSPSSTLGMTLYLLLDNNYRDQRVLGELAADLARQLRTDGSGWGTTQANAWASLGLGAYAGRNPAAPFKAAVEANGRKREIKEGESIALDGTVTVFNLGNGPLTVTRTVTGTLKHSPAEAGTVKLRKEYLDSTGKAIDGAAHGELVFVRLTVASPENVSDIVVADLLPGGLEIEDELLATRSALPPPALAARYGLLRPKLLEKRDDRFLLFGDLNAGSASFTYRTRAVSRGRYAIPPLSAEAMYDPALNGVYNPGKVFTVK